MTTGNNKSSEKGASAFDAKRLWQPLIMAIMVFLGARAQRLSRPAAMRMGARLGRLTCLLAVSKRRTANRNLRMAFRDTLTLVERDALIRRVFVHFAKSAIDFLRAAAMTRDEIERLTVCEGRDYLEAAVSGGRGVVILTAHLGNWEVLGRWLAGHGYRLTVVAREPDSPVFARYIRHMRENSGFRVLNKGASARELLSCLRRREAVALLADQNSGDLFVPFFGVPAGTVAGPASLALHTGAALIPAYCVREPNDSYRILIREPIPAVRTEDHDADIARIMAEANRVLEDVVRQYPDQWLWFHNRWRSAFEEKNRPRLPPGFDQDALRALVRD